MFLSDDKNIIDALDKFSRSPFDEDWEEVESEQFPGELAHETMPTGIPLDALMAYVDQVSQDDSFDPKIRLIAEELKVTINYKKLFVIILILMVAKILKIFLISCLHLYLQMKGQKMPD